jgi:hypothetical protein
MTQAKHRPRMALADLLILVAATALGMAVLRATAADSGGGYLRHVPAPHSHWHGPLGSHLPYYFFFALYNGVPLILVASLCVVALSLRARRSSALRLSQRPGFVLCLAAVAASALTTVVNCSALRSFGLDLAPWRLVVNDLIPNTGFMVLGSWMALAIVGRARPVSSWTDRIGYALGVTLVVLLALENGRLLLESARLM